MDFDLPLKSTADSFAVLAKIGWVISSESFQGCRRRKAHEGSPWFALVYPALDLHAAPFVSLSGIIAALRQLSKNQLAIADFDSRWV